MRYAGLKVGTRPSLDPGAPSPDRPAAVSAACPRPTHGSPPRARRRALRGGPCRRGRSGTPRRPPPAASRPWPARDGRRCCARRPRWPRAAGAIVRAAPPRPGSALPWWETFSTSTGSRSRFARTSDSASAVSSIRKRPTRASATIARSLGSAPACSSGASRAGDSTRSSMPPARSDCPASGTATATRRRRASAAIRSAERARARRRGRRAASRPASRAAPPPRRRRGRPGRGSRRGGRAAARPRGAGVRRRRRPAARCRRAPTCAGPGSAWRRPDRCRGT